MRNVLMLILISIPAMLVAQDFNSVRDSLWRMDTTIMNRKGMIVANQSLNKYMGAKVAYYLASSGDLSLYKMYAIFTPSDNSAYAAYNIPCMGEDNRVRSLTTVGANLNYANAMATIFSQKKFQGNLSLSAKWTHFFRGGVYFDTNKQVQSRISDFIIAASQKEYMHRQRVIERAILEGQMAKDSTEIIRQVKLIRHIDSSFSRNALHEIRAAGFKNLSSAYLDQFTSNEASLLDSTGNQSHNGMHASWVTFSFLVPAVTNSYSVADSNSLVFNDKSNFPFDLTVLYSNLIENRKRGVWFFTFEPHLFYNNSIMSGQLTKSTLDQYKNYGGTDTLNYLNIASNDAYIGAYSNFWTFALKGKAVYFFPWLNNSIGLSLSAEQNFGTYRPLNLVAGMPLKLSGQSASNPVNLEIQLSFKDINNTVFPGQKTWDKASVGISVGLPFDSIIYK
ncbi:MAG: hypothetical protein Q8927_19370 [Bacteroidota bacterium]|nr:hypothetical protein [Bacteroidota bacterium]MDP4255360.1 hypothetical protein [Bacteroidota bacterium]MDP4260049.1 hypothetical protein [Bacteroidota bacterium]